MPTPPSPDNHQTPRQRRLRHRRPANMPQKRASRKRMEELEGQIKELLLLNELSSLLVSAATGAEIYAAISLVAQELLPEMNGALYSAVAGTDSAPKLVARWGTHENLPDMITLETCLAIQRGTPYIAGSGAGKPCPHTIATALASICIPVIANQTLLGVLHMANGQLPEGESTSAFDSLPIQLASTATDYLALALSNLQLRQQLEAWSLHDPLTGLLNRRGLGNVLDIALARSRRLNEVFSVILIDIDYYKRFNDRFGHAAGDAVLRDLGHWLQTKVREYDNVCRLGGEEFCIILPTITGEAALARAEQIRLGAAELQLAHDGQQLGQLTLSMGVASFPQHATTPDHLIEAADIALYHSKQTGRNRVTFAEDRAESTR
jgi:diguanylate cyclase (GGDEF)-like protein